MALSNYDEWKLASPEDENEEPEELEENEDGEKAQPVSTRTRGANSGW